MGRRRNGRQKIVRLFTSTEARLSIANQHRNGNAPWRWKTTAGTVTAATRTTVVMIQGALLVSGSLRLVAVVLEPDLHLRRREANQRGQMFALRCGEVALLPEPPFQLVRLCLREEDAPLALFVPDRAGGSGVATIRRQPAVVGVVDHVDHLVVAALLDVHVVRVFRVRIAVQMVVVVMVQVQMMVAPFRVLRGAGRSHAGTGPGEVRGRGGGVKVTGTAGCACGRQRRQTGTSDVRTLRVHRRGAVRRADLLCEQPLVGLLGRFCRTARTSQLPQTERVDGGCSVVSSPSAHGEGDAAAREDDDGGDDEGDDRTGDSKDSQWTCRCGKRTRTSEPLPFWRNVIQNNGLITTAESVGISDIAKLLKARPDRFPEEVIFHTRISSTVTEKIRHGDKRL
uniref:Uncharacterized protein n=1 Tax=Anopheles atroparvus TaxID=41427 RepID=A0A182J9Q4_ANOAO